MIKQGERPFSVPTTRVFAILAFTFAATGLAPLVALAVILEAAGFGAAANAVLIDFFNARLVVY